MIFSKLLLIAAGGAIGALLRYVVSGWAQAALGGTFPWGTLAVNLAGCFLIGFLWTAAEHVSFSGATRTLVFTGVLGAFTTFSTYGLESLNLLRDGEVGPGLTNILVSNVLGLIMVYLGFVAARYVFYLGGSAA